MISLGTPNLIPYALSYSRPDFTILGCEPIQLVGRDQRIHTLSMAGHPERSFPSWEGKLKRAFNSLVQVQDEAEDYLTAMVGHDFASAQQHLTKVEERCRSYEETHLHSINDAMQDQCK